MTSRTEHQGSTYQVGRRSGGGALAAAIALLAAILASRAAQAQTYTVLYTFTNGTDGGFPQYGAPVPDGAGNLYGVAATGGDLSCPNSGIFLGIPGCGVVFKLDLTTNEETVLYTFTGQEDGALPFGGLIRDATGNLYGSTVFGGRYGAGVVFKVDPSGHETVLHSFNYIDGANPTGELVRDKEGNLYGTTLTGGNLDGCNGYGCGVIFELDPSGREKVLHRFIGLGELYGANPLGGLIRDAAGNLYGIAQNGGDISGCSYYKYNEPVITDVPGCGVIFKLDPAGRERPLHVFGPSPDGSHPLAALIRDAAGNLYGTTFVGGAYGNGTVFKLDPTGHETVLYNFTNQRDGSNPWGGLVQDEKGNLYGTANHGGSYGVGTVFKLDPAGNFTVLHTFTYADGAYPEGSLLLYQGAIYGFTAGGGALGNGNIFKITIP